MGKGYSVLEILVVLAVSDKILETGADRMNKLFDDSPTQGPTALKDLMGMLAKGGLAEQAQSWVGTGQNMTVSGKQIAAALPAETLKTVAQRAGFSPQEAAEQIAKNLPGAVDKLTPGGDLPQADSSLTI
ncbi:YidB family protein [Streptomyces sp. G1]|uniref:YidB family protein n=1 Tax=Streptomyces sp. G1 TaxID=361572 RepID=UPI00202E21BB|nr:YidB family protein [Streptomyces sp. G1]MCM1969429.1 YidB family protein [Streptomyces sp. G1]